jgi:hypothetical protein
MWYYHVDAFESQMGTFCMYYKYRVILLQVHVHVYGP